MSGEVIFVVLLVGLTVALLFSMVLFPSNGWHDPYDPPPKDLPTAEEPEEDPLPEIDMGIGPPSGVPAATTAGRTS